ncbi:hypothetical protein VPHD260_0054 [Vibrio phage D260]
MFFRQKAAKIAKEKNRRLVLLTHGRYDRMEQYQDFTAFYVDGKVFRVWKDGEITRSDPLGWAEDSGYF